MSGENAAAIAYGQTGSGKTFTMLGPPLPGSARPDYRGPERGLAPRVTELLFAAIARLDERFTVRVSVTFLEVYNEQVYDLLLPRPKRIKVRVVDDSAWIPATVVPCATSLQVMEAFDRGMRQRSTGSTAANETSSRSHAIMRVFVQTTDSTSKRVQSAMLQLVDLAGSEAVADSHAMGDRLKEAQKINS